MIHRAFEVTFGHVVEEAQRVVETLINQLLLINLWPVQHVVQDLLALSRVTNANTQAMEVTVANMRDDVLESVVTARPTTELQAYYTGRQIKLVMHNQQLFRRKLKKSHERCYRLAATIHERGWLQQAHACPANVHLRRVTQKATFAAERRAIPASHLVQEPEAGVMTRLGVVVTGVTKADHEEVGRRSGSFAVGPPDHRRSARGSVLVAAGVGLGVTVGTRLSFGAVSGFALLGPANRFTS